jgi:sugar phosphate isomerase/epimerase
MVRSDLTLALTPDTRRPVDTATLAAAARAAGFTAIGMVSGRFDPGDAALLAGAGLRCHELLGLQVGPDAGATIAAAERLAEDAASLDAPWVNTTFVVEPGGAVDAVIARCAALFDAAGSGMAIEFSPLGPVATIADGLAAVAAAAGARAGLAIDSWNFCFGGSTWDDLERVPLDSIAYLQFADALAPVAEVNFEEAMTRRALPGDGILELDRFASTMLRRGWVGVVSMQVLSDELRALPVGEYCRRVHDAATRYWN